MLPLHHSAQELAISEDHVKINATLKHLNVIGVEATDLVCV